MRIVNKKIVMFYFVVMCVLFPQCAHSRDEDVLLRFIHISDTHLNHKDLEDKAKLRESSEKALLKEFEQINKLENVDFILATGDNINKPEEVLLDRFLEITMVLKAPLYAIFGNHDVGVNVSLNKEKYIEKFNSIPNPTSFINAMSYYSFSPNEFFTVICLDTTTEEKITTLGLINDEQLLWFENELEKNKDKYILVALHSSPIEPIKMERHFFIEPDKTKLLNIINKYPNIVGIFSGDYHIPKLFKEDEKIYSVAPAAIKYPCAFREVIIKKKDYIFFNNLRKTKTLIVEFKWHILEDVELLEKSKQQLIGLRNARGLRWDRQRKFKVKVPNNSFGTFTPPL